jgi:CRISPR-associated protein Csd1
MILQALVSYAERKGLLEDTSCEKRAVHFQLRLDVSGRVLALVPLGDSDRGLHLLVPTMPKRSSGITPGFLVDNAAYVLGVPKRKKGSAPTDRDEERAQRCLEAFTAKAKVAFEATGDDALGAVVRFLERLRNEPAGRASVLSLARGYAWTGDETIAFVLDTDGTAYVHERPRVRAHWALQRGQASDDAPPQPCLVTGAWAAPARLHGSIKRIPEAQSSGAALVSFNAPAFTSHSFEQGSNAPVSPRAADGYVRALNHMLERDGEKRRFRSGVAVGQDAVILFWTRDEDPTADVLLSLLDPFAADEEQMRATLEAAWKGLAPAELDSDAFYALTVSGNASRVVVRDWFASTAGEVKRNVRRYFEDLALDGPPEPTPIPRLLRTLEATPTAAGDKRGLTTSLATRLFRSALYGAPFPREILAAALARIRVPPREQEWRGTLRCRIGLIKATLIRMNPGRREEIPVSLDPKNLSVPYLLGRLFAAIERLQGIALGDVNASIRDKYFGAASATPALVFPRLIRVSMHHANKAERDRHAWPERIKAEVLAALPAEPFPRILTLEEQGLFAIGYYHQRQAFFTKHAVDDREVSGQSALVETA